MSALDETGDVERKPIDEIDPEESPFAKCEECGAIYQKSKGHHCPATGTSGEYIPADEVRERIRAIEGTKMYRPERTVLAMTEARKKRAYHLPNSPMNNRPQCVSSTMHEWQAMSQEEAHERGRYPCGHCWPVILEAVDDE